MALTLPLLLCLLAAKYVQPRDVILMDTTKMTNLDWTVHKPNPQDYNTGWLEESYTHHEGGRLKPWRSYTVCDFDSDSVNNWLRTPYLEVGEAERIYLEIKFSMRDCSSFPGMMRSCKETFTLLYLESDYDFASHDSPSWSSASYDQLDRIAADEGRFSSKDEVVINTETRSLPVTKRGLYFAFHDEGACMSLLALRVYYVTCPRVTIGLATFPETAAGPQAASIKSSTGRCVARAVAAEAGAKASYLCKSDGSWVLHSGPCECQAGHEVEGQSCSPCHVGDYKPDRGNSVCERCPPHSYSTDRASTACTCQQNYYRAPHDSPHTPCTQPPSAPRNVTALLRDPHTIILTWLEPLDLGGRSDVRYRVECSECSDSVLFHLNQNQSQYILSNLQSSHTYHLTLFAENGVSSLSHHPDQYQEITIKTDLAVPYDVRATHVDRHTITLTWKHVTGAELYQIKYYASNKESNVTLQTAPHKNFTATNLEYHVSYVFQIRAKTGKGWGPYSEPIYISTGDQMDADQSSKSLLLIQDGQLTGIIAGSTIAFLVTLVIVILVFIVLSRRGHQPCGVKGSQSDCDSLEYKYPHEDLNDLNSSGSLRKIDLTYNGHLHPQFLAAHGLTLSGYKTYIDPHTYEDPNQAVQEFAREISVSLITIEAIIGGGEFGDVCKGTLRLTGKSTLTVAIKTLKPGSSDKSRLDFLTEASIMGQFDDPNVIYLQGVVTKSNPIMIITEYMANGSLDTFLRLHDGQLNVHQLLLMLRGIASGMRYLSEMNFIHRDLAARNILVDENLACKVADFGLSREIAFDTSDGAYTTKGGKIPVRWTAPEAIAFRKFTSSSDVWSYGVVMWEVMSFGERPYWNWSNQDVIKAIEKGYRLPPPMGCPAPVHQLMLDCWQTERTCRPKFSHIVQNLQTMLDNPDILHINVTTRPLPTLPSAPYCDPMVSMYDRSPSPSTPCCEGLSPVSQWLHGIKMGRYCEVFQHAGYSQLHELTKLTLQHLNSMGVTLVGHQKKILSSVQVLQSQLQQQQDPCDSVNRTQGFLV